MLLGQFNLKMELGNLLGGSVFYVSVVGINELTPNLYDVYGSFAVNYGGSGSFVYLGLYTFGPEGVVFKSRSNPLGDRIIIKSATASASMTDAYIMTVNFLDRKFNEPMSSPPSVLKTVEFEVENHIIKE